MNRKCRHEQLYMSVRHSHEQLYMSVGNRHEQLYECRTLYSTLTNFKLKLDDDLHVQADKLWYNYYILK